MRFRWLDGVKLWSAAVVAGIQHQQHRSKQLKTVETSHQQPQQVDDAALVQPERTQDPEDELERKIDFICKEALKEYVLGAGFAVAVSVNGEMKYRKAFGVKDFENFVPAEEVEDFKVMIYSVSKPFTAHCWMKFMDENGLDWKSHSLHSVLRELPKFGHLQINNTKLGVTDYYKTPSNYGVRSSGRKARVGAKELLTHTAGVLRQSFDQADFTHYHTANDWFNAYKHTGHILQDQPGVAHYYSNIGYDLVAAMLERLQRNTFRNYCMEELANLSMSNTTIGENQDVLLGENFPGFASWPGDPCDEMRCAPAYNLQLRPGSAALVSDVDDMDRFGNVTARMYKQAYLKEETNQNVLQKLPLSKEKIRMQNGSFWASDMEFGEFRSQNVGWLSFRELQSNAAYRRRLKMRLAHNGEGMGTSAIVSVSFHKLDVDRAQDSKDDDLARQLVPVKFQNGTIKPCVRRQPAESDCVTPWELPPAAQCLYDGDWKVHARERLTAERTRIKSEMTNYFTNAYTLLHMISNPPDRDSYWYNWRLGNLLRTRQDWWEEEKTHLQLLERKIFRQLIREHERASRKEVGSLPASYLNRLLEFANVYVKEFKDPLVQEIGGEFDGPFRLVKLEMDDLMAVIRRVPGSVWLDRLGVRNDADTIRLASSYDVNQPFNVNPALWASIRDEINAKQANEAGADGDRFAEIDLTGPTNRGDPFWTRLSLQYASYSCEVGCDTRDDFEDMEDVDERRDESVYHDAEEGADRDDSTARNDSQQEDSIYYDAQDGQGQDCEAQDDQAQDCEAQDDQAQDCEAQECEAQDCEEENEEEEEDEEEEDEEEEDSEDEDSEHEDSEDEDSETDDSEEEEETRPTPRTRTRPDWTMSEGRRMYSHVDLSRYDENPSSHERVDLPNDDLDDQKVPDSWHGNPFLPPPSSKSRRVEEITTRSIVVSIACNQRLFDVEPLSRKLDDAFAEHFFSPEEVHKAGGRLDDDDGYTDKRRKRRKC